MAAANNHRIAPALLLVVSVLVAQLAPAAACPTCPTPTPPPPPPPKPTPVPCPPPPSKPTPAPYTPSPSPTGKCPLNTLKLLACVDALNGLVHAVVGANPSEKCCPLLKGVADLDAALCLCTAIKAKVPALGLDLVVPIAVEVLVNECHKNVPASFKCPS